MKKKINPQEATAFDLLHLYVEEMENCGANRQTMWIEINESFVDKLSAQGFEITLTSAQKLADQCIANEWLEHNGRTGKHQYDNLELTATGLGIVRSRQQRQKQLEARGLLKRISDYIEDHKGLFVALGAALGLVTLLVKLLSNGSNP